MTILITGGAGFIGSNLIKSLLAQNNRVVAIDNFITGSKENITSFSKHPKFSFIKHDIVKPLPTALSQFKLDEIYHLACPTGVPNIKKLGKEMLLTCSEGTKNVLDLACVHKAKLLFTSSSEVYGDPQVIPQTETYCGNVDPVGARSPYEEGKRFSESIIMTYIRKYKLNAKIVRVFNTYGPGMSERDTRVIPTFMFQAINNKPVTIHGQGKQTRTFCYVDDLINGLKLIMKKGKADHIYNLGNNQEITILELANLILTITKSSSTKTIIERPLHDHQSRKPSLKKIYALGWKRKIGLKKGLLLTFESS